MVSRFALQIVHLDTGTVVAQWQPRKPETDGDVIDALCARVKAKGVGVGCSAAHVEVDLRAAWHELLRDLKSHL